MVVMRVIDAIYAMPNLLIAICIVSMLRSNISATAKTSGNWLTSLDRATDGLIGIFIVLSLTHWLTVSRLVRAQVLSIKEREHVEAARGLGARDRYRPTHILPHVLAPVIIAIAFGVPGAIMLEEPVVPRDRRQSADPLLGLMISDGIKNMRSHPYMLISPALTLGVTLLAFTFLGDGSAGRDGSPHETIGRSDSRRPPSRRPSRRSWHAIGDSGNMGDDVVGGADRAASEPFPRRDCRRMDGAGVCG